MVAALTRFMIGLVPVVCASSSMLEVSHTDSTSTFSPARLSDSKLFHKRGFNFRAFRSASAAKKGA